MIHPVFEALNEGLIFTPTKDTDSMWGHAAQIYFRVET